MKSEVRLYVAVAGDLWQPFVEAQIDDILVMHKDCPEDLQESFRPR